MLTKILLGCIGVLIILIAGLFIAIAAKNKKVDQLQREAETLQKTIKDKDAALDAKNKTLENYTKAKNENEELLQAGSSPTLSGFNANVELLQKLRDKRQ